MKPTPPVHGVDPLFLVLAGLAATSTLALAASARFPEVLLDVPSISVLGTRPVLGVAGLLGLAACGLLVPRLSRAHGPLVRRLSWAGGGLLAASALLSLLGTAVVARTAFWCAAGAPLVLAAWTIAMTRELGRGRAAGVLGAAGLVLMTARSALWGVNLTRPVVDGFWVASAMLTVLALLFFPLWLLWLVRMGLRPSRPGVFRRAGAGLAAVAVTLTHAGVVIVTTPTPETEEVPAVPSPGSAAFYLLMLALSGRIAPASDMAGLIEQRKNERFTKPENPPGATLEHVDANGVPADWICAPGVSADRAVLYLHGGGFVMPVSNGHRRFSVTLSRELDACVLLPNYRTAPEHPFPAPVEDTVHAFEYLLSKGVPARRIVILGDSCGGTFALSAALMLRESGKSTGSSRRH